jgi:protein SOK2
LNLEEDQDHEHETEYHQSSSAYGGAQPAYPYQPSAAPTAPGAEMPRVSDITSPQQHPNGSARATPRTSAAQTWQGSYQTPQRSNTAPIYSVMEPREAPNGAQETYYQPAPSYSNGAVTSNKRGREDDDAEEDVKRAKTDHDEGGPVGGASPYTVNGARNSISRGKR